MLSTFIMLPFVIKIFVLSIFERPFKKDFPVLTVVATQSHNFIVSTCMVAPAIKCTVCNAGLIPVTVNMVHPNRSCISHKSLRVT